MSLWFVFIVLSFLVTGAHSLYLAGLPTSPGAILRPGFLLALLLILTAVGLLKRKVWSWSLALALSLWLLISAMGQFLPIPPAINAFNLLSALPLLPNFSATWLGPTLLSVIALANLRVLFSPKLSQTFLRPPPAIWKVGLAFIFALSLMTFERISPPPARTAISAQASREGGRVRDARTNVADPTGPGVVACKISLDETRLLLIMDNGRGHAVDLRTGKLIALAHQIRGLESDSPIGPDADTIFDGDRHVLSRFSDPKFKFGIGGSSNDFVSFTSSPDQIIVHNREAGELRRIQIPIGTVIWRTGVAAEAHHPLGRVFTSPDYVWMVVQMGKGGYLLVHLREGRASPLGADFTSLKAVQFHPHWVRLAGPAKDESEINLVFDLPSGQRRREEIFAHDHVAIYDGDQHLFVTDEGELRFANGPALPLGGATLGAAVLNPSRYLAAMQEGRNQMVLADLESKQLQLVGQVHDPSFTREHGCFAVSPTHRLFAAVMGDQLEIFWSAFVGAGNFRSVVLKLPNQ